MVGEIVDRNKNYITSVTSSGKILKH